MDSDYLGIYFVLVTVLLCALTLGAAVVSILVARSVWRKWRPAFDSTGRRLALAAGGATLFLLLLVVVWLLVLLLGLLEI